MATVPAPEPAPGIVGGAGIAVGLRARQRGGFEAIGLLLGILGVLVVVAFTLGVAPPV